MLSERVELALAHDNIIKVFWLCFLVFQKKMNLSKAIFFWFVSVLFLFAFANCSSAYSGFVSVGSGGDYVTDGVDDNVDIQSAIDFVNSNGNGVVDIISDMSLSSAVIWKEGVAIDCHNNHISIDSPGIDGFIIGSNSVGTSRAIVQNCIFDGKSISNGDSYDTGIGIKIVNHSHGQFSHINGYGGARGVELVSNNANASVTNNVFLGVSFRDTEQECVLIHNTTSGKYLGQNNFFGGWFLRCGDGVKIKGESTTWEVANTGFYGSYFESQSTTDRVLDIENSDNNIVQGTLDGVGVGTSLISLDANSSGNIFFVGGLDDNNVTDNGTANSFFSKNGIISSIKQKFLGGAIFNTNSGSTPFYIGRNDSEGEALKITVDDSSAVLVSDQDENTGVYGSTILRVDDDNRTSKDGTPRAFFSFQGKSGAEYMKISLNGIFLKVISSGATDSVASGTLVGALCITTTREVYIDTDGVCSN